VGISAIPRGKVSRAKGRVERCPLCGKSPIQPYDFSPFYNRHPISYCDAHVGCNLIWEAIQVRCRSAVVWSWLRPKVNSVRPDASRCALNFAANETGLS
jgi:hypothetical protein